MTKIINTKDGRCIRVDADDDGKWITLPNGAHVHLNEGGDVDKGPKAVKETFNENKSGSSKESSKKSGSSGKKSSSSSKSSESKKTAAKKSSTSKKSTSSKKSKTRESDPETTFEQEERRELNKLAKKLYGTSYKDLDDEEKYELRVWLMEERGY